MRKNPEYVNEWSGVIPAYNGIPERHITIKKGDRGYIYNKENENTYYTIETIRLIILQGKIEPYAKFTLKENTLCPPVYFYPSQWRTNIIQKVINKLR